MDDAFKGTIVTCVIFATFERCAKSNYLPWTFSKTSSLMKHTSSPFSQRNHLLSLGQWLLPTQTAERNCGISIKPTQPINTIIANICTSLELPGKPLISCTLQASQTNNTTTLVCQLRNLDE